jgi:hypothetical protein
MVIQIVLLIACIAAAVVDVPVLRATTTTRAATEATPTAPTEDKRFCHRQWPSPGQWKDQPPFWQPNNCKGTNQEFGPVQTKACMKGRTLYTIGNSIGRQAAFGMVEMLGGATVKRENQRDECPKHETTWGDSCHQDFADVKIKYLFMQFMDGFDYTNRNGFPYFRQKDAVTGEEFTGYMMDKNLTNPRRVNKPFDVKEIEGQTWWADDNCIQHTTRTCLKEFFKDSKEEDILIFTLGMSYLVFPEGPGKTLGGVDTQQWLRASASAFRAHIASVFKGQVYHVSLAQPNLGGYHGYMKPFLEQVNFELVDVWNTGSEDKPWYVIDQWAINQGRSYMYNDHLHFNGPLTHAMLHQVLNLQCPNGGIPDSNGAWPLTSDYWDKVIVAIDNIDNTTTVATTTLYYCMHDNGKLLKITPSLPGQLGQGLGPATTTATSTETTTTIAIAGKLTEPTTDMVQSKYNIPSWLSSKSVIIQSIQSLQYVLRDKTPLPIIKNGMVLKGTSDRSVYLIENGLKREFPNGDVFVKHGFEWEQIVVIPDFVKDLLSNGAPMQ